VRNITKMDGKAEIIENRACVINKVDQVICHLIIQHQNKLFQQGINVTANVVAKETVNVPNSNDEKDYVIWKLLVFD